MKKILGFIISLIMIFSTVGCIDNDTNPFPINPDSSNSATATDESSKDELSNNTETEEDDSSSNKDESQPSNESNRWTGFH